MPAVARHITAPPDKSAPKAYLVPKSIPPRIRKAITAMVFDGLKRPEAAAAVGLTDNTLYRYLRMPEALKFYRNECEVLRTGQRHKNLHRAVALRDEDKSGKVVIDAMKFLENDYFGQDGSSSRINVNVLVQPGYICDISQHSAQAKQILQLSGPMNKQQEDQ